MSNNRINVLKQEEERLTTEELREFKGFENCNEKELQKEAEFINTFSRIIYNFLLKPN